MSLRELTSSPTFVRLSMRASQVTPEWAGHRLAWWMAGLAVRLRPAVYRVVQANLGQVLGAGADRRTLDETTCRIFHTTLRGYYDLYRALRQPSAELQHTVDLPADTQAELHAMRNQSQGTIFVFPHLGNFDLGGQALGRQVSEMQLLTLPNPPPGFQRTNELRQQSGVRVTPLSTSALRQAIELLRRGGVVAIAGDRPVSELDPPVPFFGRPARVPSGHVRLALKTGAVLRPLYCIWSPETRRYALHVEPPLEMLRGGSREEEVQLNLRQVLDALEGTIRRWLGQWQMYVPVWPDLLQP